MSTMTDNDYVAAGGTCCPVCRSTDIESGYIEVDAGSAWQHVQCNECGASWNDIYRLVGYSDLDHDFTDD